MQIWLALLSFQSVCPSGALIQVISMRAHSFALFPGVFLFSIIQWSGVVYDKYQYPDWAEFCGWVLALASMLWIPGVAIYKIIKTPGSSIYQRICFLLRPDQEEMKAIEVREGLATHSEMQNL